MQIIGLLERMKESHDLAVPLAAAAQAARNALYDMKSEKESFLEVIQRFKVAVDAAEVKVDSKASKASQEATDAFAKRYDDLRESLDGRVEMASDKLSNAFSDMERDADFVTIMLFGRTRAGKSTTMEALTGGDGATIGVGKQHTTTEVKVYYFPRPHNGGTPKGPALRIVDTPGIEGFEGDALASMAEQFIERSDHILFLLSDDKSTADELDRFGMIKTQGKDVTVLLNVKAKDEDLDLLISNPEFIFRDNELDGHTRRISGYLERKFDMPPPQIIPIHARSAWIGRREAELPQHIEDRELLTRRSRLPDVENRIKEFIQQEAIPARLSAPRDLLFGYLLPQVDECRAVRSEFRQMTRHIDHLAQQLESGTARARCGFRST